MMPVLSKMVLRRTVMLALTFMFIMMICMPAVYAQQSDVEEFFEDDDVAASEPVHSTYNMFGSVPLFDTNKASDSKTGDAGASFASKRTNGFPSSWSDLTVERYGFEMSMLVVILMYLGVYVVGKRSNKELARKWMRTTLSTWESQFAHIGSNEGHKLIRDGPRDYVFYASGRQYVKHAYGFIRLEARHDVFQYIMDKLLFTNNAVDRVKLKFTFEDKIADPFMLAILPKKNASSVIKNRWDLDNFPKSRDLAGFPKEHLTLLTDAPEFAQLIWEDERLRRVIFKSLGLDEKGQGKAVKSMIEEIVLTDMPTIKPETVEEMQVARTLTVSFRLDDVDKNAEMMNMIVDLCVDLVDYVGRFGHLVPETKAKVVRMRQAAVDVILRAQAEERKAELVRKKLAEKKAKAEEAARERPEELRKMEMKERKKALKKSEKKKSKIRASWI